MAHVLVVEDDPLAQAVLEDLLTEAGHQTRLARDWVSALGQLADGEVSVMILDMHLPGIPGDAIAELLHKREDQRAPAVLIHSGLEAAELQERATKIGAHGFLCKGCPDQEILDAVTAAHKDWTA